jgi:hypothetical protein
MQFLVRENQVSVGLIRFHSSQSGHLADLTQLREWQTEQEGRPALVNNFFLNHHFHALAFSRSYFPRLVHHDGGPIVLFDGQYHRLIDIDIPGIPDANPYRIFRFPNNGSTKRYA